jgi:hypothetical protein
MNDFFIIYREEVVDMFVLFSILVVQVLLLSSKGVEPLLNPIRIRI